MERSWYIALQRVRDLSSRELTLKFHGYKEACSGSDFFSLPKLPGRIFTARQRVAILGKNGVIILLLG